MKAAYFTPQNVSEKAEAMLEIMRHDRAAPKIDPQLAALLVLDMQQYFLDPAAHAYIPSAPAIILNIQALINAFVECQRPVIFTQHINTPENAGTMLRWWRDLIRGANPLSIITPALDTRGHVVVIKSQYDAFYQTDLESQLHRQNVTQIVISGVMTHLCCETTARTAFMRGFDVFFTVDGTATYNEDFHRASLLNLAHGFATLMLARQLLEVFTPDGS